MTMISLEECDRGQASDIQCGARGRVIEGVNVKSSNHYLPLVACCSHISVTSRSGLQIFYNEWSSRREATRNGMSLQVVDKAGHIKISSNRDATYASRENERRMNIDKLEGKRADEASLVR